MCAEFRLILPEVVCYNPTMIWKPCTFFVVAIAGQMNPRQQDVIEYLKGVEARKCNESLKKDLRRLKNLRSLMKRVAFGE